MKYSILPVLIVWVLVFNSHCMYGQEISKYLRMIDEIEKKYSERDNAIEPAVIKENETEPIDVANEPNPSQPSANKRLLMQKKLKRKWENIKDTLVKNPDDIDVLIQGVQTGILLGEKRSAIQYARHAVDLIVDDPDRPIGEAIRLQRSLIGIYLSLRNIDMAVVEFKKLSYLQPNNINLKLEFADFLIRHGYAQRAFLVYKAILRNDADNQDVIDKIIQLYSDGYITHDDIEPYVTK